MRFSGKRLILQARFPTVHYNLLSTKVTDSVVVSSKLPNTHLEVISKNNLETSGMLKCSIFLCSLGVNFENFQVQNAPF